MEANVKYENNIISVSIQDAKGSYSTATEHLSTHLIESPCNNQKEATINAVIEATNQALHKAGIIINQKALLVGDGFFKTH